MEATPAKSDGYREMRTMYLVCAIKRLLDAEDYHARLTAKVEDALSEILMTAKRVTSCHHRLVNLIAGESGIRGLDRSRPVAEAEVAALCALHKHEELDDGKTV